MSEFQAILSAAQLTKHYEVLRFLTQHPNEPYTVAQLDALLPRGVAIQRFPEEWFALIEDGACWHRSIELQRPPQMASAHSGEEGDRPSKAMTAPAVERARLVLRCSRTEIRTLEELQTRLASPSTQLDPEGCVALHTDQLVITPACILRAVRVGLAYYFPDSYDKTELKQFGMRDATSSSPSSTGVAASLRAGGVGPYSGTGKTTSSLLDSFRHLEESRSDGDMSLSSSTNGSSRRVYIALPPGVCVQHRLLTRRGVPEQEDYALPTRLYVGERVLLLFDNLIAVKNLKQPNVLRVDWSLAGVKLTNSDDGSQPIKTGGGSRLETLAATLPEPLRIRKESVVVRSSTAISSPPIGGSSDNGGLDDPSDVKLKANEDGHPAASSSPLPTKATTAEDFLMAPPAPLLVSTKVKMEIEALQASTLKLILTVNGVENVVNFEVREEVVTLPGVLILRDRQLDGFALPEASALADPVVNPHPSWNYPYESVLCAASAGDKDGIQHQQSMSPARLAALSTGPWSELVPLPWTQNPSPLLAALREWSYPVQHNTVQAATCTVFSAQSLADEARLRAVKERLQRQAMSQEVAGTGVFARKRRRRQPFRGKVRLSNRHLLHFGLDFSIPFSKVQRRALK